MGTTGKPGRPCDRESGRWARVFEQRGLPLDNESGHAEDRPTLFTSRRAKAGKPRMTKPPAEMTTLPRPFTTDLSSDVADPRTRRTSLTEWTDVGPQF